MSNILINIIIGIIFGIFIFFITVRSVIYRGPNSNIFRKEIIKNKNKCYMFVPKIYLCPFIVDKSTNINYV